MANGVCRYWQKEQANQRAQTNNGQNSNAHEAFDPHLLSPPASSWPLVLPQLANGQEDDFVLNDSKYNESGVIDLKVLDVYRQRELLRRGPLNSGRDRAHLKKLLGDKVNPYYTLEQLDKVQQGERQKEVLT